jgi:quercetin dioxygenase-like cupin family protein
MAINERKVLMTEQRHQPGETTGTAERPAQQMAGPILAFDLPAEIERLQAEEHWRSGDRNTKALLHHPDLRVVLMVLKAGARINQHQAAGRITIHALQGSLRLNVLGETRELRAGQVLALDRSLVHDVEALEDSAFVLTVAWST